MNRQDAEKAIVGALVDAFLAEGVKLSVESDGIVYLENSTDKEEIIESLFAVDEAFLLTVDHNGKGGWVFLVFGNDGYDVIADHTMGFVSDVVDSLDDFVSEIEEKVLGLN